MERRKFILSSLAISASGLLCSWHSNNKDGIVMTVKGPVKPGKIGVTLAHEHILVDFSGAANYDPTKWDQKEVVKALLPYLQDLRKIGIKTFFEYTPAFLGRDPLILQRLSEESGLNIVTNTGYYGAVDNKYLPQIVYESTADDLAKIWIKEYQEGINGTGIKPGFIKISVNPTELSPLHKKIVQAAAKTHLETGLTIASHTGPWVPATEQLAILKQQGVHPSAFIWVHAQNEKDWDHYTEAAEMGAWVSLDGVQRDNADQYIKRLTLLKEKGLLHKVLISQDAGWYEPGKPWSGPKRKYTDIHSVLIPGLRANGFTEKEVTQLLQQNPMNAYTIQVRAL
jgi:phosphotriesterase-related protein